MDSSFSLVGSISFQFFCSHNLQCTHLRSATATQASSSVCEQEHCFVMADAAIAVVRLQRRPDRPVEAVAPPVASRTLHLRGIPPRARLLHVVLGRASISSSADGGGSPAKRTTAGSRLGRLAIEDDARLGLLLPPATDLIPEGAAGAPSRRPGPARRATPARPPRGRPGEESTRRRCWHRRPASSGLARRRRSGSTTRSGSCPRRRQ